MQEQKEIAFKIDADSKLYQAYYLEQKERRRFAELAKQFIQKYFPSSKDNAFAISKRLQIELDQKDVEPVKNQLMKASVQYKRRQMYQFKASSFLGKAWVREVYDQIDNKALYATRGWFLDFGIWEAEYSLWDDKKGTVYGLLKNQSEGDTIEVPCYAIPIKMSEYYSIMEQAYPD